MIKFLGRTIPKKSKLLLANGLIIVKLNFLLPIYGGTQEKYVKKIQIILNNTVRFITGAKKRDKTQKLMESVGWLSAKELIVYHTLVMGWEIIKLNTPQCLSELKERQPDNNVTTTSPRLMNTSLRLRWRVCNEWNKLPSELRQINILPRFKTNLKKWFKKQTKSRIQTLDDRQQDDDHSGQPPPGIPPAPPGHHLDSS